MIAREAVLRAREEAAAGAPLGMTNHAVLAILMAAASTEGFVNEFPGLALGAYSTLGPESAPASISECARVLVELERAHEQVTTKYLEASKALGKPFNTGAAPFQAFKQLIDLRNAIMHIRPTTEGDRHPGERVANDLAQRGVALVNTGAGAFPWFDRVMTQEVALWAHDSALAMISAFWAMVPAPRFDPLETHRRFLRNHPSVR